MDILGIKGLITRTDPQDFLRGRTQGWGQTSGLSSWKEKETLREGQVFGGKIRSLGLDKLHLRCLSSIPRRLLGKLEIKRREMSANSYLPGKRQRAWEAAVCCPQPGSVIKVQASEEEQGAAGQVQVSFSTSTPLQQGRTFQVENDPGHTPGHLPRPCLGFIYLLSIKTFVVKKNT